MSNINDCIIKLSELSYSYNNKLTQSTYEIDILKNNIKELLNNKCKNHKIIENCRCINILPGSLFQLMKLFVDRLHYEVSIQVNLEKNGLISLYLTKGYEFQTDYVNELKTLCGIHIHTHQISNRYRNKDNPHLPPSYLDINHCVQKIINTKINKNMKYSYDYLFDGTGLWYYKANEKLKDSYLRLMEEKNEDKINIILEDIKNNTGINAIEFIKNKLTIHEYLEYMKVLIDGKSVGIDIGIILDWQKKAYIEIPDNLECNINEIRDNHIILPNKDILNNIDLELLYDRAIKIFDEQEKIRTPK
jgi:ribosomal protein S19